MPLLEVKEAMTRISGRLPSELERGINKELMIYQQRMRSMLARFPYQKIQRLLDMTANNLSPAERELFYLNTQNLYELCKKYSEDIRGLKKERLKNIMINITYYITYYMNYCIGFSIVKGHCEKSFQ